MGYLLTCSQQVSKEPSVHWRGFQLAISSALSTIQVQPCPVGITVEVRVMREGTPTKIPVKKRNLCFANKVL